MVSALDIDGVTPPSGAALVDLPVLQWPAVDRTLSYSVQIAKTDTFSAPIYKRTVYGNAATLDADLVPGDYWWRYQPKGLDGVLGPWSDALKLTVVDDEGPVLVGPADDSGLTYPNDVPTLRWAAVPGVRNYEVEYANNPAFTSSVRVTTSNLAHVPTTLLTNNPGGTYHWRVRGVTTTAPTSYTKWSAAGRFSIGWHESQAPQLLTPAAGAIVDSPKFSWQAQDGAAGYELVVAADDQFTNIVDRQTVTGTSYLPGSPTPPRGTTGGSARSIPLARATSRLVRSPRCSSSLALGSRLPVVLARPENVRVDGLDGAPEPCGALACTTVSTPLNKFLLTWDPVVGASHYEVDISNDTSFNSALKRTCKVIRNSLASTFDGESASTTSLNGGCDLMWPARTSKLAGMYLSPNLPPYADVYVRVRAVAASHDKSPEVVSAFSKQVAGDSPPTLHLHFVAAYESGALGSMDTPATPLAPAAGTVSRDVPVLRWNPVPGATGYLVRISKDINFTTPVLKSLSSSDSDAQYYVTAGTSFVPPESMKDNTAGAGADRRTAGWSCHAVTTRIGRSGLPRRQCRSDQQGRVLELLRQASPGGIRTGAVGGGRALGEPVVGRTRSV